MKYLRSANVIAMVISLLSMAFGIYLLIKGSPVRNGIFCIAVGLAIFGTAYINYKNEIRIDEGAE